MRIDRAHGETIVSGLQRACGLIHSNGRLYFTEDKNNGRLFRYASGRLEIIADGLRARQGIAFDGRGRVYVAEHPGVQQR